MNVIYNIQYIRVIHVNNHVFLLQTAKYDVFLEYNSKNEAICIQILQIWNECINTLCRDSTPEVFEIFENSVQKIFYKNRENFT